MVLGFKTVFKVELLMLWELIYFNFNDQAGEKEDVGTDIDDEVLFCQFHQKTL